MKSQTLNTLPPVAADHDAVRCPLAIELSKKSWIVAISTPLGDRSAGTHCPNMIGRRSGTVAADPHARCSRTRPTVEMISCYEVAITDSAPPYWLANCSIARLPI